MALRFIIILCILAAAPVQAFAAAGALINDAGAGVELTREGAALVVLSPGGVFLETSAGRSVVTGEPTSTEPVENGFAGTWKMADGRSVTFNVTPFDGGYDVRLSADPSEDILRWGIGIKGSQEEFFTGAMERTVNGGQEESWKPGIEVTMDLAGHAVDMAIKPTTSIYAPFYLSSAGYGVFVRGTWPGLFDFCKTDPDSVLVHFEGPSFEARVYMNNDLSAIVAAHALDAGPPLVPPKWAFSPWRWRDEHSNKRFFFDNAMVTAPFNSQVVEDILMMRALDIPCGVYWIDRPWATGSAGYDDFEWDKERFPNAGQMVKWLQGQDIRLLVWIAPWVMGDMYRESVSKGFNLPGQTKHTDNQALVDFTNPDAVAWWQQGLKKMLDSGIAGFKLDRSEEIVPDSREVRAADGRTARELRNDYPHLYLKSAYDIARQVRGDDFVLIPRAAYTGSSRYGVFWGGDVATSQWGLRASIIALQKSAVMGYPYWGSDTCGYSGAMDRETCARWLAFSCFCPIMEVGPTQNRAFWDMPLEQSYDADLIAIWRTYAKIHEKLKDYTYTHAQTAAKTGMPIVRPLFMVYPDQVEAFIGWDSYLYGPDILVSPVWQKGSILQATYLPKGSRWIDAWEPASVHEGGATVSKILAAHTMPIFIREGSGIDLGDLEKLHAESMEIARKRPGMLDLQNAANFRAFMQSVK